MRILVLPDGTVRCLYSEAIDISVFGTPVIQRASHVEPDAQGRWQADLGLVGGPVVGPFARRSDALKAESDWLEANWLLAASK